MVLASHKLVSVLFVSFLCSAVTEADGPTSLYHNCSSNKNLAAGSAYQNYRRDLLYYLSSNATGNTQFYNTTVAGTAEFYNTDSNPSDSDAIFGLFMCRGDVTPRDCFQCVSYSTQRLSDECPLSKEAIIWNDECLLRYSNRSFFSTVDTRPRLGLLNTSSVSNEESFMRLLFRTINETADEAAKRGLGEKKYSRREANISASGFPSLYCLAQCTPDLSPEDCRRCLSGVIGDFNWCCRGRQRGRVLYPSCDVRYETYPFYQNLFPTPPPPSPFPFGNSSHPQGNQQGQLPKAITVVILVFVGVLVSVVVVAILSCFIFRLLRRTKKSHSYFALQTYSTLATIEAATNKFSQDNRIGKGGFGEVYKGILSNGQEIAVKRLSKASGQGAIEFKNEILLILKTSAQKFGDIVGILLGTEGKITCLRICSK